MPALASTPMSPPPSAARRPAARRSTVGRFVVAVSTAAVLLLGACSSNSPSDDTSAGPTGTSPDATNAASGGGEPLAYAGHTSDIYADPTHWLCRPDITDGPCHGDLDATVVAADGSTTVEKHQPATDPKVDCFYVYPTVSQDDATNSDLVAGPEENSVTLAQFARYNQLCRTFAPVYRQNTLGSLLGNVDSPLTREQRGQIAYDDVVDAWKTYIADDNGGRGFVLIGHSQGSGMLTRLIKEEIDPNPALRSHLISAYLLGVPVAVPTGGDVGGDFAEVPLCRDTAQTGCAVAYSTFRSTAPPPSDSIFGRARDAASMAACVNPAAPAGGSALLTSYLIGSSIEGKLRADVAAAVSTPFVKTSSLLRGECVVRDGFSYLSVTVEGGKDAPITDIYGDLTPPWGLHLVDSDVTMGDQLTMVAAQAEAWLAAN